MEWVLQAAILIRAAVAHYSKVVPPLSKDTLSLNVHGKEDNGVSLHSIESGSWPQGKVITLFLEISYFMHGNRKNGWIFYKTL